MKNLLYVLCLPNVIFAYLIVAVIKALWGSSMVMENGILITELKEDSWPMRTWYKQWGGTCFGYGIMLAPNMDPKVKKHELQHTIQVQAASIVGLFFCIIFSIIGYWWIGLLTWAIMPVLSYLAGGVVAAISGGSFYMDNLYERAARDSVSVPLL